MANDQFPPEIIYQIFARTPIKSLARFQRVCKLWLKYISDPYLQTIHLEEHAPIIFQQSLLPGDKEECNISFLCVIQGTTTKVRKYHALNFCYEAPSTKEHLILGSCNGLILICKVNNHGIRGFVREHFVQMAVIDPLTKQCRDLPPIKNFNIGLSRVRTTEAAGIGFDDSTNTLKTVFVILNKKLIPSQDNYMVPKQLRAMVHCSGSKMWREIGETPAYPISGESVFGDGRLHWLVNDKRKIVWFDVKTEKFGGTDYPLESDEAWYHQLVDLNDEVGFAYVNVCTELWVLKQDQEWVLRCRFDLSPILPLQDDDVEVSGCWNKEGDILLSCDGGKRLFVYSPKTGDFQRVVRVDDLCEEADVRMYRSNLFSRLTRFKTFKW